jgi:hypothetical protein
MAFEKLGQMSSFPVPQMLVQVVRGLQCGMSSHYLIHLDTVGVFSESRGAFFRSIRIHLDIRLSLKGAARFGDELVISVFSLAVSWSLERADLGHDPLRTLFERCIEMYSLEGITVSIQ